MPEEEEIKVAQAPPNYLTRPRPGDGPVLPPTPPPSTTPGGTPIGPGAPPKSSEPKPWIERGDPPPKQQRSSADAAASMQKRKDTMLGNDFNAPALMPKNQSDLASWANSLSDKWLSKAKELEAYYKSKGYTGGWFDPKIKGKDAELRDYLFMHTAPHWHEKTKPRHRGEPVDVEEDKSKSGTPTPDQFFNTGKGKRSELKEDAPALASLGGAYMGGEDG